MYVSLQMERYNRVYMYIYDFKYLEGYTTGRRACLQRGGTLFNSLPFDSFGFCIMCTVAFLIKKKLKCIEFHEGKLLSSLLRLYRYSFCICGAALHTQNSGARVLECVCVCACVCAHRML